MLMIDMFCSTLENEDFDLLSLLASNFLLQLSKIKLAIFFFSSFIIESLSFNQSLKTLNYFSSTLSESFSFSVNFLHFSSSSSIIYYLTLFKSFSVLNSMFTLFCYLFSRFFTWFYRYAIFFLYILSFNTLSLYLSITSFLSLMMAKILFSCSLLRLSLSFWLFSWFN